MGEVAERSEVGRGVDDFSEIVNIRIFSMKISGWTPSVMLLP